MKKIWNFRLYLEGIKKVRVLGIAFSIIVVVLNAMVPITHFLIKVADQVARSHGDSALGWWSAPDVIANEFTTVPMALLMVFTPFFFYTMFAYLNSRSESDFYHAIPYKRSTVFVAFTAAIYTWIFGILIASSLLTGLLWAINPFATISFSAPFFTIAEYMVVTLLIGAYAAIAVSLTGTRVSEFFITLILLFFIRIAFSLFVVSLDTAIPVLDLERSMLLLLSPRYYFPLAIFWNMIVPGTLANPAVWIYTVAIAAVGLVIACVLYVKRKSETATKSAPNRVFQHIFRCLFTLPWVAGIATVIVCEPSLTLLFVLCTITVVVYFLYELITTKSGKSMLKSAPFLGVLVAFVLLFLGCVYGVRAVVLSQDYSENDIEAVGIADDTPSLVPLLGGTGTASYESLSVREAMSSNPEARKLASAALHQTLESVRNHGRLMPDYQSYDRYTILLKLRSGRVVGKNVAFRADQYDSFIEALMLSEEYGGALTRLPEDREILVVEASGVNYSFSTDAKEAFRLFRTEYERMPDEEKATYKQSVISRYGYDGYYEEKSGYTLTVSGSTSSGQFISRYPVPDTFTETNAFLDRLYESEARENLKFFRAFADGEYDRSIEKDAFDYSIFLSAPMPGSKDGYRLDWSFDSTLANEEYRANAKKLVDFYLRHTEWSVTAGRERFVAEDDHVLLSFQSYGIGKEYKYSTLKGTLNALTKEEEAEAAQLVQKLNDATYYPAVYDFDDPVKAM